MFKGREGSKGGWGTKGLLTLLFVGAGLGLYDFARFAGVCSHYARLAKQMVDVVPHDVDPHEAIVVLTGDYGRIPKALELLRLRGSPLLIISGLGKGTTLTDLVNKQGDASVNVHAVWRKIITESQSGSTMENAQESGKILLQRQVERVILVTSEYHMLRALRIFRLTLPKMDYTPYPVSSVVSELNFVPSRANVEAFLKIWFEYWKYFVFRAYAVHQIQPIQK